MSRLFLRPTIYRRSRVSDKIKIKDKTQWKQKVLCKAVGDSQWFPASRLVSFRKLYKFSATVCTGTGSRMSPCFRRPGTEISETNAALPLTWHGSGVKPRSTSEVLNKSDLSHQVQTMQPYVDEFTNLFVRKNYLFLASLQCCSRIAL